MDFLSKDEAIDLMKTATNVHDWNSKRDQVQLQVLDKKEREQAMGIIDQSGLIVKVLGKDKVN